MSFDRDLAARVVSWALNTYPRRPAAYPLPLAPEGVAWWQVNLALCLYVGGWSKWQGKKEMAEVIPAIEALRA